MNLVNPVSPCIIDTHISARNSPHNSSVKFSESVCVPLVASLTEEMTAQSIAYHAHGTADGGKSCCYPWLVCHDIKSAMHCSLRLAPTMINHLTSIHITSCFCLLPIVYFLPLPSPSFILVYLEFWGCSRNIEALQMHFLHFRSTSNALHVL